MSAASARPSSSAAPTRRHSTTASWPMTSGGVTRRSSWFARTATSPGPNSRSPGPRTTSSTPRR
eukprot:5637392-Alexandrium_andersonii.AAC.1